MFSLCLFTSCLLKPGVNDQPYVTGTYLVFVSFDLIFFFSIFMPQTLKKLEGHIAFGLSVHACVRPLLTFLKLVNGAC